MPRTVYLDNAATTWPKPKSVINGVCEAIRTCGNPGRGSHKLALAASDAVYECREALGSMFDASPENVVFTVNATEALNFAIKGLASYGCHILADNLCHNAVRRPVIALSEKQNCRYDFYDATLRGELLINEIERLIRPDTKLIIATHRCNISSNTLPIAEIGRLCRERGIHFVVDAAGSAGHLPISVRKMGISALCIPGHKGLYGPMGVGALISGDGVRFETLIEGGSGAYSLDAGMPEELPERLEAGTAAVPAIAGLREGVRFISDVGMGEIHRYECMLAEQLVRGLYGLHGVKLYGDTCGSTASFNLLGKTPSEVGTYLSSRGICVRTGYHCAPIAHKTLGSFENGSVRASFSYMNKMSDVDRLIDALRDI